MTLRYTTQNNTKYIIPDINNLENYRQAHKVSGIFDYWLN